MVVYAVLVLAAPALLNDPDTLWHIEAGRWMLAHRQVPSVDIFSHTFAGQPWVSYEWLAEVIFAAVFDRAGWAGMVVLTAGSAAAAFGLFASSLARTMAPAGVAIAGALGFLLTAPHLVARPHVLAWPVLIVWTTSLTRARAVDRRPPWWLLGLMLVWANLHGGFVIGLDWPV